jgi:hypothetical protein
VTMAVELFDTKPRIVHGNVKPRNSGGANSSASELSEREGGFTNSTQNANAVNEQIMRTERFGADWRWPGQPEPKLLLSKTSLNGAMDASLQASRPTLC